MSDDAKREGLSNRLRNEARMAHVPASVRLLLNEVADALAERDATIASRDAEIARLTAAQAETQCDVCLGQPLSSGKQCACGGTGRLVDAILHARERLFEVERERDALKESARRFPAELTSDHLRALAREGTWGACTDALFRIADAIAPQRVDKRVFRGVGHLEYTGYIPAGSAEERERATPIAPPSDGAAG